jgi:hypothetical protein
MHAFGHEIRIDENTRADDASDDGHGSAKKTNPARQSG